MLMSIIIYGAILSASFEMKHILFRAISSSFASDGVSLDPANVLSLSNDVSPQICSTPLIASYLFILQILHII